VQSLAGEKIVNGWWPVDVDKLEASEAGAATGGRTKSKSDVGAGSHRFLLNNRECVTVPYLARQLSVFCRLTSKFIQISHCSRKTMVAFKRHDELYWFRPEPYDQSQR
jgi:hypothetical protein